MQYSPAAAQSNGKALAFNALTINDGLSQGMVIRIFQDRYGFMWFATLDGLNRYDGYHFVVYRHDAQDPSSITEGFVQVMFEDLQGRLWIGTVSGGLDLFDRETETFIHVKQQEGKANKLAEGTVNSISQDEHGDIWVCVFDKLYRVRINEKGKPPGGNFIIEQVNVPYNSGTSFLSITKGGKIYYINAGDGVMYKLNDEKTANWSVAFKVNDYLQQPNKKPPSKYRIIQLLEDRTQGKYYVFHEDGITCFNEKTAAPEKLYPNAFFKNCEYPLQACLDSHGIAWFSGRKNVSFFDTRTGQCNFATGRDSATSERLTHIYSTFIDRSGLLWIGTNGYGILKRNIRSETFHNTGASSNYAIKETDDGKIIVEKNLLSRYTYDKIKGESIADTKAGKTNNETKYIPRFWLSPAPANPTYITRFFVAPVATDKRGAWFTDSNRLRCYEKATKKTTYYPLPVAGTDGYNDVIQCKIKDSSGNIWLATTQGLLRFSLANGKWTIYKSGSGDPSSLRSNLIFSLCLDPLQPNKYLWIGTGGTGLYRMDLQTGKCICYSTKDGLPNNVIYGILNDDDNNLWISTNKGLSCFNPQKRTFRNFDYNDGLQSNEFDRGAYGRTKDGCLFFGGINGFNYFYPREILNNRTVPQIVITGLKIRNQPVPIQPEGSPLTKAIYLTGKLTLPYVENFVSFEFASMDFTNSEKNTYQYKLQGFEKDWINSGNTHSATYTNLDPGTYTFSVKGSNNDGTWNETGTSIQLIILPPWYMTWWFRTALTLTVLSAAYTFYRYRLAQALKLQSIRDRIAGDLHDEVGSNLSNIFIFSNIAQQKVKANDETGRLLQRITDYTQQSMEAMDDIVWMINTRNDRFENIMIRMRTLAAEFSETSGCVLHLHFDENLNDIHLNMEHRKNFYLIYKEAINNASKYAECKTVWINMKLHHNKIVLEIKDDGKGFDTANAHNGNGLLNMEKRAGLLKGALTVTSTIGEGTSLQLSFKI